MGEDEVSGDRPSPTFGDPSGWHWSAFLPEGAELSSGPPPWVRTEPRTAAEPYPLRMFAEDSCDFALWGPVGEAPPGVGYDEEWDLLEDVLPISPDLRERLVAWASAHWARPIDWEASVALDWQGFDLSRELATTLPDVYSVQYSPNCAGEHRAEMRRRAHAAPVPRWSLRR